MDLRYETLISVIRSGTYNQAVLKLEPSTNSQLQCFRTAAVISTNHDQCDAQYRPEIRPENSIILARRYSQNHTYQTQAVPSLSSDDLTTPEIGYIHEHYSPVLVRKNKRKPFWKTKSFDHNHRERIDQKSLCIRDNFKSSPEDVNEEEKSSRFSVHKLLRKLDNKANKTLLKYTSKFVEKPRHNQNGNLRLLDNNSILSDTNSERNALVVSELVLRKPPVHQEVNGSEVKSYQVENRTKTKYSPPPDQIVSTVKERVDTPVCQSGTVNSCVEERSVKTSMMLRFGFKLRERVVVCVSVVAVLFTLMLVMDIQMDLGVSRKHLMPSHGRIKYVVGEDGPGSAYNSFKNRLLQKTNSAVSGNISKESLPNDTIVHSAAKSTGKSGSQKIKNLGIKEQFDGFNDLVDYLALDSMEREKYKLEIGRTHGVIKKIEVDDQENPSLGELKSIILEKNATTLELFHYQISQHELYTKDTPLVEQILHEMRTEPVLHVAQKSGGTQLKLIIDYPNELQALFKPMR
ncbi:hypothetical protein GWI33_020070 [Rhynchophorus ferrugineus]|uniref:Uncharacterized protein n=1 Tax=Rhynchophorus ferrugineus TaxID=354439 RepID=A0A834I3Z8_RHYFE|nr:hypothetical protein GWI33_020070 [Rhynchophorus ferrugineus]